MKSKGLRLAKLLLIFAVLASASTVSYAHSASSGYIDLEQSPFAPLSRAVGLAWTGDGFIASDRANLSAAELVMISADGKSVTPYVPSFKTVGGSMEDYIAVSDGREGFPMGYYVLSFDSVYRIDPKDNSVSLFSTPEKGQQMSYVNFDGVGTWGFQLLSLYQNGDVWSINSTGSATKIASVGRGQNPENVVVAPMTFGSFGGDLIISEEIGNHSVLAISPANRTEEITLARFPAEAPERVIVLQKNSDLYIGQYDKGTITRFPASDFATYTSTTSLLVITEGESGQNGSMDLLTASGNNVSVTTIFLQNNPHFEAAVFVNVNSTNESTAASSSTTLPLLTSSILSSQTPNQNSGILIVAVAIIVTVALAAAALKLRKK